jgi:hypothetical protein
MRNIAYIPQFLEEFDMPLATNWSTEGYTIIEQIHQLIGLRRDALFLLFECAFSIFGCIGQ